MNSEIKRLYIWLKINKYSLNIKKPSYNDLQKYENIREDKNDIYIDDTKIITVNKINLFGFNYK